MCKFVVEKPERKIFFQDFSLRSDSISVGLKEWWWGTSGSDWFGSGLSIGAVIL
jgi:hypothetical protein